eukprot:2960501-Rhodomonas_salina.1
MPTKLPPPTSLVRAVFNFQQVRSVMQKAGVMQQSALALHTDKTAFESPDLVLDIKGVVGHCATAKQ